MITLFRRAVLILVAVMLSPPGAAAEPVGPGAKTIVLIGGNAAHGPFVHDSRNAIAAIRRYLTTSPEILAMGDVAVEAYPDGWPSDPHALDRASTIVWYFDGLERHPLLDAGRRDRFAHLIKEGVGLVTFHQASTLLADDRETALIGWLGGARYGMVDRTTEVVAFTPADHPISRGVQPFAYRDEFYPTLRFGRAPITPILTGALHTEAAPAAAATQRTVAWAFDRPGGGRSFGFTGLHYLVALDQPELRKLLLNAIVWSAGIDVPKDGIGSAPSTAAGIVTRAGQTRILAESWGELRWFTSAELGNSTTVTTGQATFRPGQGNGLHSHPNCDEILRVVQGRILQTIGDRSVEMGPGDIASIPQGIRHKTSNIGKEDAVLALSYSSANRLVVGE